MIPVASLLNPTPPADGRRSHQPVTPRSSQCTRETSPPARQPKKRKMSKDSAKGKIRGEVRYPPHEKFTEGVEKMLQEFQVSPMTGIAESCKHIPYNSGKRPFFEKTGREGFEAFMYTFKVPGRDPEHAVLWDYNIGLVKTAPARMLEKNPGLANISHSITGGALIAQGYWLPFEAAKAVAASLCYNIRYALVPLFGEDFISLCVPPDSPEYNPMIIDREITNRCTEAASKLRRPSDARNSPPEASTAPSADSTIPETPAECSSRSLRHKGLRTDRAEIESGYGTDTDISEGYSGPPATLPGSGERSGPRVRLYQGSPTSSGAASGRPPPTQDQLPKSETPRHSVRTATPASVCNGDVSRSKRSLAQIDGNCDVDDDEDVPSFPDTVTAPRRTPDGDIDEEGAAHLLMKLHVADAALGDHKSKRRRSFL
ncbi:hypothetical protein GP486_007233 [Trichoglossum hirsutum]|uniref:HTH APSES-type domain-containing protein n=1 Tax=Trichoglossum hirsutum TaxID=265104 RepID=A0A9P8L6Z5_9PEZI|nr:hypothetical protein GP486_007233 [Trichoglossum hirsutum]